MDSIARHVAAADRSGLVAVPRHIGLIMDGNRRWAHARGYSDVGVGHRAGAEHLTDLLHWLTF